MGGCAPPAESNIALLAPVPPASPPIDGLAKPAAPAAPPPVFEITPQAHGADEEVSNVDWNSVKQSCDGDVTCGGPETKPGSGHKSDLGTSEAAPVARASDGQQELRLAE